jgi:hypothetical protein
VPMARKAVAPTCCIVALCVVSLASDAVAQNPSQWELFGGYQYTRVDIGAVQDLANSLTVLAGLPSINVGRKLSMNGWNVSLQENSADWWGGIVDFSGNYGTKNVDLSQTAQALGLVPSGTNVIAKFKPTIYTFAGGPQFTYRKRGKVQPFARIMFGAAHSDLAPDVFTSTALSIYAPTFKTNDTSFTFIGGGGVDYRLKSYAAFRVAGDYIHTSLFSETQNNLRMSVGVDFRIASK